MKTNVVETVKIIIQIQMLTANAEFVKNMKYSLITTDPLVIGISKRSVNRMANVIKGKLTISAIHSNSLKYNNKISLRLTNENYDLISEVVIEPENFALALTGLASQECEIEIFNERVQQNDR